MPDGVALVARGAEIVARRALAGFMPEARLALVDGAFGVVMLRDGSLFRVLRFTVVGARVTAIEVLADPERLAGVEALD